jgi:hypothetical protein
MSEILDDFVWAITRPDPERTARQHKWTLEKVEKSGMEIFEGKCLQWIGNTGKNLPAFGVRFKEDFFANPAREIFDMDNNIARCFLFMEPEYNITREKAQERLELCITALKILHDKWCK